MLDHVSDTPAHPVSHRYTICYPTQIVMDQTNNEIKLIQSSMSGGMETIEAKPDDVLRKICIQPLRHEYIGRLESSTRPGYIQVEVTEN